MAFGYPCRVDPVSRVPQHTALDPCDVDLGRRCAEVDAFNAIVGGAHSSHEFTPGASGIGAFKAETQPLPYRCIDFGIHDHSCAPARLVAVPVADAAGDRVLIEESIGQKVVVRPFPSTLSGAVAAHHNGEHRPGIKLIGHS